MLFFVIFNKNIFGIQNSIEIWYH